MKKKMLFMAALAGVVTLGSCVKDDVSSSVEAVRNAKAQELLGKAANENAQAALANAEAALTNATQSAKVALAQAEAALKQAEAKAAELDTQLKADSYAEELESIVTGFAATTATNNAAVQQQLNALADALREASTKDLDFINNLIARYNSAYSNFVSAQGEVLSAETDLQKAKIDKEFASKVISSTIFDLNNTIEEKKALIDELGKMESSAPTVAQANIEIGKLEQEKVKAMAEFGNSDAVKALIEAGQALAAAKKAFDAQKTASFGKVNAMVTEAFGQKVTYYVKGTKKTGYLEPGTSYDSDNDAINDATVAKPAWWTANYYESVGDPKAIEAAAAFANPNLAFYDNTKLIYVYTFDSDSDGKFDSKPSLKGTGASVLDGSDFEVAEYRVNDRTKLEADKYFQNKPNDSKTALTKEQNKLNLLIAETGTDKDSKSTKYKNAKGEEVQTLYAKLAEANENKTKADAAKTTAEAAYNTTNEAYENAKSALATAYKNAAADPSSTKAQGAIEDAKEALAIAMEALFGEAQQSYVKKSNVAYNETYFDKWIAGTDTPASTMTNSKAGAKAAYENFDTVKEINAWIAANLSTNFVKDDPATTEDESLDADGNKIPVDLAPNHVYKDSVKDKYEKAAKEASTAATAVSKAKIAINGEYGSNGKLITEGQVQKIETQKDKIATKYQPEADEAAAVKAAYEAAVKAADVKSYQTAAANLEAAANDYNSAAFGVLAALGAINDYDTQINAYKAVITNDIKAAIAEAEEDLAKAEKELALINYTDYSTGTPTATSITVQVWDPTKGGTNPITGEKYGAFVPQVLEMSYDQIVAFYENALANANIKLDAATAELALAQKALEEFEIDLDGDEPAAPAEGGDDAQAEGGDDAPAEGGDDAPAEGGESEGE